MGISLTMDDNVRILLPFRHLRVTISLLEELSHINARARLPKCKCSTKTGSLRHHLERALSLQLGLSGTQDDCDWFKEIQRDNLRMIMGSARPFSSAGTGVKQSAER